MIKNIFFVAGMSLICGFGVAQAKAKDTAAQLAARKAIAAQYERISQATRRNDLPGVMKVIAPDFQYFDATGHVTDRVGYQQLQYETMKTRTKLRYAYRIKSIQWRGQDAIVQAENTSTGVYERKQFDLKTTSRDYWSPSKNGWLLRQSVQSEVHGFINGQRVTSSPDMDETPNTDVRPDTATVPNTGNPPTTGAKPKANNAPTPKLDTPNPNTGSTIS